MYAGGTTQDEVKNVPNALTTVSLQPWQLEKRPSTSRAPGPTTSPIMPIPMGLEWTDQFLMKISEITGKPIPASLEKERGRLVDMITDSHAWLHGKKFALWGDPDFVMGLTKFLLELGAEPTTSLPQRQQALAQGNDGMLEASPYGKKAEVQSVTTSAHGSLVFTDKPDFMIGNSYGKFIQRDTITKGPEFEVPLIRIGFPIFDRHHLHRDTTLGYKGAMYILKTLVNTILDRLDQEPGEWGRPTTTTT